MSTAQIIPLGVMEKPRDLIKDRRCLNHYVVKLLKMKKVNYEGQYRKDKI